MSEKKTLVVPIIVKGIFVDKSFASIGPTADFSFLPWNDGKQDLNPDYAPLGQYVEATPLQSANGKLKAGIHLHWTLPPALVRSLENKDPDKEGEMPFVPVKWNVVPVEVETVTGEAAKDIKSETVWSDYIHKEETHLNDNFAQVPIPPQREQPQPQPFRYMGTSTKLGQQPEGNEYYKNPNFLGEPLTALGYGSMSFAPYYPDCREVFGHHVPNIDKTQVQSVTFFVRACLYRKEEAASGDGRVIDLSQPELLPLNQLKNKTGWSVGEILEKFGWGKIEDEKSLQEIHLAGAVKIYTNQHATEPVNRNVKGIQFSIGNTGTEALSAYLADEMASEYGVRIKMEEQLEAILMKDKVHGHAADLSLKFLEKRHLHGFKEISAGTNWTLQADLNGQQERHLFKMSYLDSESEKKAVLQIRKTTNKKIDAFAQHAINAYLNNSSTQPDLVPDEVEKKLRAEISNNPDIDWVDLLQKDEIICAKYPEIGKLLALYKKQIEWLAHLKLVGSQLIKTNLLHHKYDSARHEVNSMKRELFGDWYKYMLSKYPPPESLAQFDNSDYPDPGEVAAWLQNRSLEIRKKQGLAGQVYVHKGSSKKAPSIDNRSWENHHCAVETPLLYLPLDEINNQSTPNLGSSLNATIKAEGPPSLQTDPSFNNCIEFDGKSSYLEIKNFDASKLNHGFTIAAWVYFEKTKNYSRIIDFNPNPGKGGNLIVLGNRGTTNDLIFYVKNDYQIIKSGIREKSWQHIALTQDDKGNTTIYINGEDKWQGKFSLPRLTKNTPVYIGKSSYQNEELFEGKVAQFLIYDRPLESHELKQLSPVSLHLKQKFDVLEQIQSNVPAEQIKTKIVSEPAQPFYVPKEPVLLIAGLNIPEPKLKQENPTEDDFVAQTILSIDDEAQEKELFKSLYTDQNKEIATNDAWNPFILEWEAEFLPLVDANGKNSPKNRFTLAENKADTEFYASEGYQKSPATTMRGRTFLTSSAKAHKLTALAAFLELSFDRIDSEKNGGEAPEPAGEKSMVKRVLNYVTSNQIPYDTNDTVLTAARAYLQLKGVSTSTKDEDLLNRKELVVLSQALGGFNDAMLQLEQHLQPPLHDPLGTQEEDAFSRALGKQIGEESHLSPNPSKPFIPVRAGSFRLIGLRLIDTWGRYQDLLKDHELEPVLSEPLLPITGKSGWAGLQLRVNQPLRMHANWLSALKYEGKDISLEHIPFANPIVGWVCSNPLDRSLLYFDSEGTAAGYFNRQGDKGLPPGRKATDLPTPHPGLQHLLDHAQNNQEWLQGFINATDNAMAHIAPHEFHMHNSIAMLTGKPIAVVRMKISFELMGMPAENRTWATLKDHISRMQQGEGPYHSHWNEMKFPVRLGNYKMLNDCLIGFWVEDKKGKPKGPLYTTASRTERSDILPHNKETLLWLPLNGEAITLTLLIDPRGPVHITSGILPAKTIKLRTDHCAPALERISTWFLNAPLLQPQNSEEINLLPPREKGHAWEWVEAADDHNALDSNKKWKTSDSFKEAPKGLEPNQENELKEGWLILKHD